MVHKTNVTLYARKKALSDIQKLIFEKLRMAMIYISFTADVS